MSDNLTSLGTTAARGAAWTIGAGLLARGLGLVGTLLITARLDPTVYGEAQVAVVLVATVHYFSLAGIGPYLVSRPDESSATVFHVTVISLVLGFVSFGLVALFARSLAGFADSPGAARYVPVLVAAALVDRIAFVPDRLLGRDLRFKTAAVCGTAGDLAYPLVAVALAMWGWGGWAIVMGNVARTVVKASLVCALVSPTLWLRPVALRWSTFKGIFGFALPNGVAGLTNYASRQWDNLLTARLFGPPALAYYQLAYNLSDVPASQVGERIGDVLLPTFARLERDQRAQSLSRALRLMALLMFPMAAGLAIVAPDLIAVLLRPEWHEVAARLTVLSALSATFPFGYMALTYLNACRHPRPVMVLGLLRLSILLGGIIVLGELGGPRWSCAAVGLAFGTEAVLALLIIARLEGLQARALFQGLGRPALATAIMAGAVISAALIGRRLEILVAMRLAFEIAAGALVYVTAVWLLARSAVRDLLEVGRRSVRRS